MKYHPYCTKVLIPSFESSRETVTGRQFNWGGSLPNDNEGAQRLAQGGWQSPVECKRISQLNCESDRTSRYESRG
jgi:hypothetical protein